MANDAGGLRIAPADAKARVDRGDAIILDVVASHVWPQMHRAIAGAFRIDPSEIGERFAELPRERQIIAYCT
jgi:rhodanese-related sulfurtransferase